MVKKKPVDIDVLSHVLVPEMKIISDNERKKVFEKYNITENNLPKMLLTDSVARVLLAKAGDILSVHRKDSTGTYMSYRLVVDR